MNPYRQRSIQPDRAPSRRWAIRAVASADARFPAEHTEIADRIETLTHKAQAPWPSLSHIRLHHDSQTRFPHTVADRPESVDTIHSIDRPTVRLYGIDQHANRTPGVLSKMFSLAEVWGLRPDGSNPCRHVKRYKERKRERFLSPEETDRLGQVLADPETR